MRRALLGLLAAAVLGAAFLFFVAKRGPSSDPIPPPDSGEAKGQTIEHFELEGYDDDGSASWRLVGESAKVTTTADVFIERNVVLTMLGGAIIRSDKVFWQNAKTRFVTSQPVKVLHRNIEVEGRGAIGKLNQKSIQINQDVRMKIEPDGTIVTCRGPMRILQGESRVTLYHDVRIRDTRGDLASDRMDAFFDPETKKIVSITAAGNVRITHDGDVSIANKAIYDTRTGSVRLEGMPEISIRDTGQLEAAQISSRIP
ncbi:MAG: LPS export ABC transporter periplasmic protein LptC [Candidatus Omnitrophica bacterium]|nr:LPS export ABC transporter periplasmic protein LptC [Candidatus Omnitrophota bacterium]